VTIYSSASERELVLLAQNGDREAFSELVCLHAGGVRNVIYRMCGDVQVAEDAAQETFLRAWLHFGSFRPQASLRSWLYRIGLNAATDVLRQQRRVAPEELEDLPLRDPHPDPEGFVSQEEQAALVQKAVLSLPDASRAVLVLREYEGLSYQEIADALDIPIGTVMSRLSYGRKLLKEKLEPVLFLQAEADYV
jgi:RNA polymerase sigma-70 factor (ECF subfamily)